MIFAVANIKGGVGKTTTAMHFAAALQLRAPTLLLDSDEHQSSLLWNQRAEKRGKPLPFRVAPWEQGSQLRREYTHIVIDTGQNPSREDLEALASYSDMLVIPVTTEYMDTVGAILTVSTMRSLSIDRFRVLPNCVPPANEPDGAELRAALQEAGIPLFEAEVPRLKVFDKASTLGTTVFDAPSFPRHHRAAAARASAVYLSAINEVLSHV